MNRTDLFAKMKIQMDEIKNSMVEPGYDDHLKYREALARYHAMKDSMAFLKPTEDDD